MTETTIPLRISWLASGRRAYGYMAVEAHAIHLICLRDENETAAVAGQAAARQFGLIGALVSAGVSGVREMNRAKELLESYMEQQHLPIPDRMARHALSRTIHRNEMIALRTGPEILPTFVTHGGLVGISAESADVGAAIEGFCRATQVPNEHVKPSTLPKKILLGLVLAPVALFLLHCIVCVPFAFRHLSKEKEALGNVAAFEQRAKPLAAGLGPPVGKPLADACASVLRSVPIEQQVVYVASVPDDAQKLVKEDYYKFPQYSHVEPPYSSYGEPKLNISQANRTTAWAPSFGRSFVRMLESPFGWAQASSRIYVQDVSGAKLLIVAKADRVEEIRDPGGYSTTGRAFMTARVLDFATGAMKCEGDLTIAFPPDGRSSSVGFGFSMAHGIVYGMLMPTCGTTRSGLCREVHDYAGEPSSPTPTAATAATTPSARASSSAKPGRPGAPRKPAGGAR
jgi:hypothetical protein